MDLDNEELEITRLKKEKESLGIAKADTPELNHDYIPKDQIRDFIKEYLPSDDVMKICKMYDINGIIVREKLEELLKEK